MATDISLIPIKKVYTEKEKINQFFPEVYEKAVIDSSGNDLETKLQDMAQDITALSGSTEDLATLVEENERAISAALNDLNSRIERINTALDNAMQSLQDLESEIVYLKNE